MCLGSESHKEYSDASLSSLRCHKLSLEFLYSSSLSPGHALISCSLPGVVYGEAGGDRGYATLGHQNEPTGTTHCCSLPGSLSLVPSLLAEETPDPTARGSQLLSSQAQTPARQVGPATWPTRSVSPVPALSTLAVFVFFRVLFPLLCG